MQRSYLLVTICTSFLWLAASCSLSDEGEVSSLSNSNEDECSDKNRQGLPEVIHDSFKLKKCDSFAGNEMNQSLWAYNYTWGENIPEGQNVTHNFNAYMDKTMVKQNNGYLRLKAEKLKIEGQWPDYLDIGDREINSRMPEKYCKQLKNNDPERCKIMAKTGAITSRFKFQHGYLEARLRLPATNGFWPAFWMLHGGWPPEIDILEVLTNIDDDGNPDYAFIQNYHFKKLNGNGSAYKRHDRSSLEDLNLCDSQSKGCGAKFSEWNTFGLLWQEDTLSYYVNGQLSHSVKGKQVTNKEGYILLNLAVGGWANNPDDRTDWNKAHMDIDWIRLWQRKEGGKLQPSP